MCRGHTSASVGAGITGGTVDGSKRFKQRVVFRGIVSGLKSGYCRKYVLDSPKKQFYDYLKIAPVIVTPFLLLL